MEQKCPNKWNKTFVIEIEKSTSSDEWFNTLWLRIYNVIRKMCHRINKSSSLNRWMCLIYLRYRVLVTLADNLNRIRMLISNVCLFCICRPVDTPQSYSKGPQPSPAASPQSYRVPAREAPIRYVQQNPYGAMQVSVAFYPCMRMEMHSNRKFKFIIWHQINNLRPLHCCSLFGKPHMYVYHKCQLNIDRLRFQFQQIYQYLMAYHQPVRLKRLQTIHRTDRTASRCCLKVGEYIHFAFWHIALCIFYE